MKNVEHICCIYTVRIQHLGLSQLVVFATYFRYLVRVYNCWCEDCKRV